MSPFLLLACTGTRPEPAPTGSELADVVSQIVYERHLEAIAEISTEDVGWRTAGSVGEAALRAYVSGELEASGWTVREDEVRWGIPLRSTANVIADSPGGDPAAPVILLMAHGDSVAAGPGMNDNGSGVAGLITLAAALGAWEGELDARVRIVVSAWEEGPAVGAQRYFATLDDEEMAQHIAFVNVDMIGSSNGGRFLLDPAVGAPDTPIPDGSAELSAAIGAWFDRNGLAWEYVREMGADHTWALDTDIPTTFVYSGSLEVVGAAQAAAYGTVEGEAMDLCYHSACDILENVDITRSLELLRATAHGVETIGGAGTLTSVERRNQG